MTSKSFLVKYKNKYYCSKCGEEITIDSNNPKDLVKEKHEKRCKTEFINFYEPRNLDDIYAYKLSNKNNRVVLEIMRLFIENTNFVFKPIYEAQFFSNSREIKEIGEEDIYYWMEILKENFFFNDPTSRKADISETNDIEIIRKVFPNVPYIKSISDFIDIYLKKGYPVSSKNLNKELSKIPQQRIDLSIGHKYNRTKVKYCYLKQHEVLDEVFFEVTYIEGPCIKGKIEPSIKNRCIISKEYIYNPKNIDLSILNDNSVFYPQFKFDKFAKKYPEIKLEEYIASGGNKIIPFIFSSNTDLKFELIGKSGLGYIADNYELISDLDLNATNIKKMFRMPIKAVKCLNSMDFIDYVFYSRSITKFVSAYKYQKMIYTSVFNKSTIELIKDNIDSRAPRIIEFDTKDLLKYVTYTQSKVFENYNIDNNVLIRMYYDYINMCQRNNLYPGGKFPIDLVHYHDLMCHYQREKIEADKEYAFIGALENPRYTNLGQEETESSDYVILLPRNANDLVEESYNMHNCVRSYVNSVASGNTFILFLRKKKSKSKSLVTIEVTKDYKLRQVKGTHNSKPSAEIIKYVTKWARKKELDYSTCYDLV